MRHDEGRHQRGTIARVFARARAVQTLLLATLCVAAPGIAPARADDVAAVSATPARTDDGATLYRTHCAPCHGSEGRGDGPAAAALSPPPTDLTADTLTTAELMKVIDGRRTIRAHGNDMMPVWGRVFERALEGSGRQHRDALHTVQILADYVRKLERTAAPDTK